MLVNPDGRKWWRFAYTFETKEKLLSLGAYPAVSLKMARERRDDAQRQLAKGCDPSKVRQEDKARRAFEATNTFGALMAEWLAMRADSMAPSTHGKARWMLETFALPLLGPKPLACITPPDVLEALRGVEFRGKLETAHRLRARISEIFRYAIATGRVQSDPCRDLRGALKPKRPTKHHAALIDSKAVGRLIWKIQRYGGTAEVKAALKLAPLLFVRPGELRFARWSDFDLDGRMPAWRFHVQKTRTEHIVPLPTQAVAILRELQPLTHRRPDLRAVPGYLFPSNRSPAKPMSENTINLALRRMGFDGNQMTGHGFRAMARTLLSEHGWMPDIIERQLAHKAAGPLGAAYDRAQFLKERVEMMQQWADHLGDLEIAAEMAERNRLAIDAMACSSPVSRPRAQEQATLPASNKEPIRVD